MHLLKNLFSAVFFFLLALSIEAATHLDVVQISHWPAAGQNQLFGGMAVRGNYLFIMGNGLQTLDISDPAGPLSVASAGTGGWDVKLAGNYAFCATEQGLQVIDISNPLAPKLVTNLITGHLGQHIALQSTTATIYLRAGGADIFDISNPEAPVFLRSDSSPWPGIWAESNSYFFTDNQIFEDSARTRRAAFVPNVNTGSSFVSGLAVAWPYLFTAVWGEGINIYKIREVLQPLRLNPPTAAGGSLLQMQLVGDTLYSINGYIFGATDIHDPAAPIGLSSYTPYTTTISYRSLLVSGNYAYCTYELPTVPNFGLFVFDISDPTHLTLTGQSSLIPNNGDQILGDINGYLYLNGGTIFDVRDPKAPTVVSAPTLTDIDWNSIAGARPYVQVSDHFVVYGLGSGGAPQFLKPGGTIALYGDYALSNPYPGGKGVTITDLLHGGAQISTFASQKDVYDISVNGHYAYVTTGLTGLEVFDLSVITNVVRVGGISTFNALSVKTRGDYVYAGGAEFGVFHRFDFPDVYLKTVASGAGSAPIIRAFGPTALSGRLQKTVSFSSWSDLSNVTFTTDALEVTASPQEGAQFFRFVSP